MLASYNHNQNLISLKADEQIEKLPSFCQQYFDLDLTLSPNTRKTYSYMLVKFFQYLHETHEIFINREITTYTLKDLDCLELLDIETFLGYIRKKYKKRNGSNQTLSVNTIRTYIMCLNSFFKFYYIHGMIKKNPCEKIRIPKSPKRKIVRLEPHEEEKLKEIIISPTLLTPMQQHAYEMNHERNYTLIQLFLDTGIRIDELHNLDLEDVDLNNCRLHVIRKRNKEDYVYFSDYTKEWLEALIENRDKYMPPDGENALFLSGKSKRLSIRQIQHIVSQYAKDAIPGEKGRKITPHKFRATYATNMLEATNNLKLVQEQLGHDSINTTTLYADISKDSKKNSRGLLYDK